jgi:hypothetical protein
MTFAAGLARLSHEATLLFLSQLAWLLGVARRFGEGMRGLDHWQCLTPGPGMDPRRTRVVSVARLGPMYSSMIALAPPLGWIFRKRVLLGGLCAALVMSS